MSFLKLRRAMREVELVETDFKPDTLEPQSLLDRSKKKVGDTLDRLRADKADLERNIAALAEELRQTDIVITSFEASSAILNGAGKDDAVRIPIRSGKVGRLVPREVQE